MRTTHLVLVTGFILGSMLSSCGRVAPAYTSNYGRVLSTAPTAQRAVRQQGVVYPYAQNRQTTTPTVNGYNQSRVNPSYMNPANPGTYRPPANSSRRARVY